jgi:hypothetical protein
LYVDGISKDSLTAYPYRFEVQTDSLEDGVHLLEARAWDEYGNCGISPILRIHVMNVPPAGPRLIWVPDSFATIQGAINASTDFDTIRVRDGTYYEVLNPFGKGIWLESERGPRFCTINGKGSWDAILIPSSRHPVTIRGFTWTGAVTVVRYDAGAQCLFTNNILLPDTDRVHDATWTLLLTGSAGGNIVNNLFVGSNTAVQISYFWGSFENNILQDATDIALWNSAVSYNPIFHGYNLFWRNHQNYNSGFSQGAGEFEADPMIDLTNGRLLPTSPCIDRGDPNIHDLDSSRSDIGPYGGLLAYY